MLGSQLGEERHQETPRSVPVDLDKGKYYHLTIAAEANSFDIYVWQTSEKKKHYSYQYRDDVRKVNKIEYKGHGWKAHLSIGKVRLDCCRYIASNDSYAKA